MTECQQNGDFQAVENHRLAEVKSLSPNGVIYRPWRGTLNTTTLLYEEGIL